MNFNKFEVYGNPTLQQGGWQRVGENMDYIDYIPEYSDAYDYRICTLDYVPQHHPTQITITGIASKELEISMLVLRSDNYIISALGWQDNGYTFNLGSTYDKLGVMFRFKNGDAITPNQVSFDTVGDWVDIPHYIHNTSTDTITTLPAELYPNAVTATVGLKGNMVQSSQPSPTTPIQPSETGERTEQLFDETTAIYGKYIDSNGIEQTSSTGENNHSLYIPIKSGEQYTLAETKPSYGGVVSAIAWYTSSKVFIQRDSATLPSSAGRTSNTWTAPSNAAYAIINFYRYTNFDGENDMLNEGSTAKPHEPYGYKIPILSANTTTPVYLGETQSTRQIREFVLTGEETGWNRASSGGRIIYYLDTIAPDYLRSDDITLLCSHYKAIAGVTGASGVGEGETALFKSVGVNQRLYFGDSNYSSTADFKAYLAQQYSAGTPVTVWYVLATPETGIVNEPIRKIGDYADEVSGITIPTIAGENSFDVLTTLKPSEVTVNYKGWHPVSSVHERDNGAWD